MAKTDFLYEMVRDRIIEALNAGTVPWQKTWNAESTPINYDSGRRYGGINMLLLGVLPYAKQEWITFKSIQTHGARVVKGAKSYPVVYWKWFKETEKDCEGQEVEKRRYAIPFYYRVFNITDVEGLPEKKRAGQERNPNELVEACENIAKGYPNPPVMKNAPGTPHYTPSLDEVVTPEIETFKDSAAYYSTLFHELIHSTGHEKRLNRDGVKKVSFGSGTYAEEELVAEFGAAFLCAEAGIENGKTLENSAAYIASWKKYIEEADVKTVLKAATRAKKAAEHILNVKYEEKAPEATGSA